MEVQLHVTTATVLTLMITEGDLDYRYSYLEFLSVNYKVHVLMFTCAYLISIFCHIS